MHIILDDVQVYTAIEQAVQRAPLRVEALNLKGLICESRGSLSAAISALQMAKFLFAQRPEGKDAPSAKCSTMVSLNLARVFCKVHIFIPPSCHVLHGRSRY